MKAIVYYRYGSPDVLECREIERPVPGKEEVLIKVCAASLNPADRHMMRRPPYVFRKLFGLHDPSATRPGRMGRDVAGLVEAVGPGVTRFKPGEAVFGGCSGAFADYVCVSESRLAAKPGNVTFEQAASAPVAGLTALQGLRDKGRIRPGHKVLVNGAAGGVGTYAVQIARAFDAEVTAVCSTANTEMVRSIGADRVLDYTREDFTREPARYDLIFDLVANHPLLTCGRLLNPGGRYIGAGILALGDSKVRILGRMIAMVVLPRFVTFIARVNSEDLTIIAEMIANGKVRPVIDRHCSLNEVPDAVRYLEQGHARGKVVITPNG